MSCLTLAVRSALSKENLGKSLLLASGFALAAAPHAVWAKPKQFSSYYRDALVFRDRNGNGQADSGEPTATTGADGRFKVPGGKGRLLLTGGIDLVTSLPNDRLLRAPLTAKSLSTLTAVWQALLDRRQSEKKIKKLLGLPNKTQIMHFTAVPPAQAPKRAQLLIKKEVQLDTLVRALKALSAQATAATGRAGEDSVIGVLADALLGVQRQPVDLTDTGTVQQVLQTGLTVLGISVSPDVLATVAAVAAAINQQIERFPDKLEQLRLIAAEAATLVQARDFGTLAEQYTGAALEQQAQGTLFVPVPSIDSLDEDTGASATDRITQDTTPRLGGAAGPGVTQVRVFRSGALLATVPAVGGNWRYDSPALGDGIHGFGTQGLLTSGHAGAISVGLSVTIDTTAPTVPTVSPLTTSATRPTVTGTWGGLDGEELSVSLAGQTYTPGNGLLIDGTDWSLTPAAALAVGNYEVSATVTDRAGNRADDAGSDELIVQAPGGGSLTITRVSVASDGSQGQGGTGGFLIDKDGSYHPALSADGRFVAFTSHATNLVPGDTNGKEDVFLVTGAP